MLRPQRPKDVMHKVQIAVAFKPTGNVVIYVLYIASAKTRLLMAGIFLSLIDMRSNNWSKISTGSIC